MYKIKQKKSQKITERIIGIVLFLCLFLNSISYANDTLEISFNEEIAKLANTPENSYEIEPIILEIPEISQIQLEYEIKERINQTSI